MGWGWGWGWGWGFDSSIWINLAKEVLVELVIREFFAAALAG